MVNAFLLSALLLVSVASQPTVTHSYPFVKVLAATDQREVFDAVGFIVHIETNATVLITLLEWDFGDNSNLSRGGTFLAQTGMFDCAIFHVYAWPGLYDMRVRVTDALNRTAGDVFTVEVYRRGTELAFYVSPITVNSTLRECFTMQATLTTNQGNMLANREVAFWYTSNSSNRDEWFNIATVRTDVDGRAITLFNPPFDGTYVFKASFSGDETYAPTETIFEMPCIATPELPSSSAALCLVLCLFLLLFASTKGRCMKQQC